MIGRTAIRYRTVATIMIVLHQNIWFVEAMYEAAATTTASQNPVASTNINRVFILTVSALIPSSGLTVSRAHAFNFSFTTRISNQAKNSSMEIAFSVVFASSSTSLIRYGASSTGFGGLLHSPAQSMSLPPSATPCFERNS